MTRCQDCGGDHDAQAEGGPCACCAGDTVSVEACPSCAEVPADRAPGYAVTVWVGGARSQGEADRVVEGMLDRAGTPEGKTATVVPD